MAMLNRRCSAIAVVALLCCLARVPAAATPPPGYYLVWGDEFNETSLNTNNWDFWLLGTWNNAVNVTNAVSLNGSNLVITTYTSGGVNYTAMLATDLKFRPRYGYYEASIMWGDTNGMWSAFWLRSPFMGYYLTDPYVAGGELDACEHRYVGDLDTNYIANIVSDNIHWDGYGSAEQGAGSDNVGNVATGFHTYGLWWNGPTYDFSIDGSEVWNGTPAPLFGSDVYIILSSEVQNPPPHWAGYIPSGGYPGKAASTVKMTVDYFHYYAPTNVLFWTGAASPFWTNAANWISNYLPAAASDLTFSYLSSNLNCVLGQNYGVDGLIFLEMKTNASIGGTNALTLGAGGIDMVATLSNVTVTAPISLAANQKWMLGMSNVLTIDGSVSGTATLTKAEYGTLILNGTNSFSGVLNVDTGSITNDGILLITRSAAIANAASPISIRNTGTGVSTLQLSNSVTVPQNISLAGRNTNVAAIEVLSGTGNILAAGITLAGGGSNYLIQCDAGTVDLDGTISAGNTVTGVCLLTLRGNGNFSVAGSIQNGSASALSLLKTNSGTLTFSGVNTYTGATTNADGNLFVNGSLAGPLVVNGGTFAGVGTVAGDATVQSGELSPGSSIVDSIGTLSFGGNLTLGPRILAYMEIDAVEQTNDQVNVAGALTYGGTLYVANLEGTLAPGQSFRLFHAGSYGGSFPTLTLPALDAGLAWNTNGLTNGVLSIVALPETLSFTNLGGSQLQLNWVYGTLQTATNAGGPYGDIPGAASPYTIPTTNAQQFYRIREE